MRALTIVLAPRHSFICIGGFVAQDIQRGGNEVNAATPSVLNITELLTRMDNNRGVIVELLGREISRSRVSVSPQQFCFVILIILRASTIATAISSVTKYYRKRRGAFSYRCVLMITSGDMAVKSS